MRCSHEWQRFLNMSGRESSVFPTFHKGFQFVQMVERYRHWEGQLRLWVTLLQGKVHPIRTPERFLWVPGIGQTFFLFLVPNTTICLQLTKVLLQLVFAEACNLLQVF